MEDAEFYKVYNSMQKRTTTSVLKEFVNRLSWSEDENVLDVGCGPGDVTADVILPLLPQTSALVGVDISKKMVEFANSQYSTNRLFFKILDISTKNMSTSFSVSQFSKIFSFYCLHWIQDQEQMAKNLFTLLRPGGEFLLVTAPISQTFDVYKILSKMEKWKPYMKDVTSVIPRFNDSADACKDIRQVLTNEGLEVVICSERRDTISFPNKKNLLRSNEAVTPFVLKMTEETKQEFMRNFEEIIDSKKMYTETADGEILTHNPVIVVYGRRPAMQEV